MGDYKDIDSGMAPPCVTPSLVSCAPFLLFALGSWLTWI
jgi:hypothetical protein